MSENTTTAIDVRGLDIVFSGRRTHRSVFAGLTSGMTGQAPPTGAKKSLAGVDVSVAKGEVVGLIGHNGAGKTTLLKAICGLYAPAAGSVSVDGDPVLLAGLGAGMIDELSCYDNIWLYGAVCQIRRSRIRRYWREMLAWAELEDYRDAELRTLSAGMRTRLAFAIAMYIESDIVLMDEAFSAGDRTFKAKCDAYFRSVRDSGQTFIVATHTLDFVTDYCDRAVWLDHGEVREIGPGDAVLEHYNEASRNGAGGTGV